MTACPSPQHGTSPNAALANGMLRDACATLKPGETPIIHSDRGCHYRWPESIPASAPSTG